MLIKEPTRKPLDTETQGSSGLVMVNVLGGWHTLSPWGQRFLYPPPTPSPYVSPHLADPGLYSL